MAFCSNCGKKLEENHIFCTYCGTKVNIYAVQSEDVRDETAITHGIINIPTYASNTSTSDSPKSQNSETISNPEVSNKFFTEIMPKDYKNIELSIFNDLPSYYHQEFIKILKSNGIYEGKFNWAAFFFSWIWILTKGLWLLFISYICIIVPLCLVAETIKDNVLSATIFSSGSIILASIFITFLPYIIAGAIYGNNGNYWYYKTYINRRRVAGYFGDWENNQRNGYGNCKYTNKDYYSDEWVNGKRSGDGMIKYADGTKYIGEWLDDKRSGYGIYYSKTRKIIYEGKWGSDKQVKV
ncbi:MAG: DUF2628 domain-containing protein [Ruminiclostridium sp.]